MFPNNGAMPPMGVPVKKRRNRKKKPVILDPEAERQEQELRMKIKQSLHTQQVLRTEVEEDEAQRTSANVANDAMRGGIIGGHQAHAQAMGSQMNNMMMSGGMSMGFANMQPQMGGVGMQQQQQQQQYQFDNRNQQYDYHQNQEGSGIEKIIPNMQHQMQQIQQQLEIQRQQLEGQAKMKQQMEMEQQRKINQQMEMEELLKMKQQMILQQQQIQEHQHQQQIQQRQQFQPQPSLSPQPQSSFSPQPQRQDSLSGNQEFEAKLSSEGIMRRLKYEQERLLKEAQKRANANNIDNSAEKSSAISPSPPYVPAQYQQNSNFHGMQEVSGQSSQQQQVDGVLLCKFTNQQDQSQDSSQFPAQSRNSQRQNQQQQRQQFHPHQDDMAHGNFTNQQDQQVKNQTQFPPYDVQIQAQQSEPYRIQKGAPQNQQHNGKNTHNMIHFEERTMSAELSPQLQCRKSGQETLEKSLFSAGSNAESWLKTTGSVNTTDLFNNSSFSSMAYHSMGNISNMSASFSSLAGTGAVDAPRASPGNGEEMERLPNLGGGSKGNEADSKESTVDGNTSGGTQTAAGQSDRGNDEEADSTSMNKGSPHIDTTIPTQPIALQPIQENETDENVGKNLFGQSSLMMSMTDGEFVQSALSMYGANSDLAMSVDSTTLNALMRQSQTGEISDYERRKFSSSSSENNQALSPGNTTAKNDKQDVSNSNGNRSLSSGKSNIGDSANSSSVISSVSMEDNQPKESNTTNGDVSAHSSRSSRGGRAAAPRFDMMKEISQWTLNNPFDEDDDSDDIADGALAASPTAEGRVSNEGQGHGNVQRGNGFDIGDFHSLGGSIDTMNLSMMSSMTESNMPSSLRLDSMSESLKALNVSDRETGQRKG